MPPLHAAIFDLDGTLLDTLDDLADSANEALAAAGFPTHPVESYRTFVGDGMHVLIQRILPAHVQNDPATVTAVLDLYKIAYARRWNLKSKPYPGIDDALRALAAARIPIAILSNKAHHFTLQCVAHHLASHHFQPTLGQRDSVPRKPDPAAALEIAAALNLPPASIAFIGDTSTDMETATAAGMFPIGVTWGFRPASELQAFGARALVSHPDELPALFSPAPTP
jgi:phosphoglycolate phosphatase